MPFKSRKQKVSASSKWEELEIKDSSFRWEGKNVGFENKGNVRQMKIPAGAVIESPGLKRDLLVILGLCIVIISAQIALSLTLLKGFFGFSA